jgi:hypothetical protein
LAGVGLLNVEQIILGIRGKLCKYIPVARLRLKTPKKFFDLSVSGTTDN